MSFCYHASDPQRNRLTIQRPSDWVDTVRLGDHSLQNTNAGGVASFETLRARLPKLRHYDNIPVFDQDNNLACHKSGTFVDKTGPEVRLDSPLPITITPSTSQLPSFTYRVPFFDGPTHDDDVIGDYHEEAGDHDQSTSLSLPLLQSVNLGVSTGVPKSVADARLIARLESLFEARQLHPSQIRPSDHQHSTAYLAFDKMGITFRRDATEKEYGTAISRIADSAYEIGSLVIQPLGRTGGPNLRSLASAHKLYPGNAPTEITIYVDNSRTNNSHGFAGPDHSERDAEKFADLKCASSPATHRVTFAMATDALPNVDDIVNVLQYREGLEYKFTVRDKDPAWPQDETVYSTMVNHALKAKYNAGE